jgi:hypothetical protein
MTIRMSARPFASGFSITAGQQRPTMAPIAWLLSDNGALDPTILDVMRDRAVVPAAPAAPATCAAAGVATRKGE